MKDLGDFGRVPAAPGYSAEPEPVSTHSLGPSGEYPSRKGLKREPAKPRSGFDPRSGRKPGRQSRCAP